MAFAKHFTHHVSGPHGRRLHYVAGGTGDPVLLVAGWPQTWFAWRHVMKLLARRYTVVAVDPSPEMLAQLRTALPDIEVREGMAEAIPLEDATVPTEQSVFEAAKAMCG